MGSNLQSLNDLIVSSLILNTSSLWNRRSLPFWDHCGVKGKSRLLLRSFWAGNFLPAETQVKHQNQKCDQKFDFEERGYFGITKRSSHKYLISSVWSVAEASETWFAPRKITFFSKRDVNIGLPGVNPGTHHLTNRFRRPQHLAETGCPPPVRWEVYVHIDLWLLKVDGPGENLRSSIICGVFKGLGSPDLRHFPCTCKTDIYGQKHKRKHSYTWGAAGTD